MTAPRTEVTIPQNVEVPAQGRNSGRSQVSSRVVHIANRLYCKISDCWTLTKPEVNFLIALATFTGFCLGRAHHPGPYPFGLLVRTLFGTLLVASGTGTLNQFIERRFDARMRRTARRPLAAGRLKPAVGLTLGIAFACGGCLTLGLRVNLLSSELAMFTLFSYLLIYTPLKRKSPVCMIVGAIPGAMPPLIGWAGASGHLASGAWLLYGILFFWQFPHFMAIAWIYRDDYQRAGYCVLPPADKRCAFVNWLTVLPLLALILLTLVPALSGRADVIYILGTPLAGSIFLYFGTVLALRKSNQHARRLLFASIAYLPVVFGLLITASK